MNWIKTAFLTLTGAALLTLASCGGSTTRPVRENRPAISRPHDNSSIDNAVNNNSSNHTANGRSNAGSGDPPEELDINDKAQVERYLKKNVSEVLAGIGVPEINYNTFNGYVLNQNKATVVFGYNEMGKTSAGSAIILRILKQEFGDSIQFYRLKLGDSNVTPVNQMQKIKKEFNINNTPFISIYPINVPGKRDYYGVDGGPSGYGELKGSLSVTRKMLVEAINHKK